MEVHTYVHEFFKNLSHFQYEAASTCVTISKDTCKNEKTIQSMWWSTIVETFQLLAACESTYHLMKYLQPEWKHTKIISKLYKQLSEALHQHASELREAARTHVRNSNKETTSIAQELGSDQAFFYANLFNEACQFFKLRLEMIFIYQTLVSDIRPVNYVQLIQRLRQLEEDYQVFTNALLEGMRSFALLEVIALRKALETQCLVANLVMHEAVVHLHQLKSHLLEWERIIVELEVIGDDLGGNEENEKQATRTFHRQVSHPVKKNIKNTIPSKQGRSKSITTLLTSTPGNTGDSMNVGCTIDDIEIGVFRWIKQLYHLLIRKYTLYFSQSLLNFEDVLGPQFYYVQLAKDFLMKCTPGLKNLHDSRVSVALLFESTTNNKRAPFYHPNGYYCPSVPSSKKSKSVYKKNISSMSSDSLDMIHSIEEHEHEFATLKGLKAWPVIFSIPAIDLTVHHSSIVNFLVNHKTSIPWTIPPFHQYDKNVNSTYYALRLEDSIFMIIVDERRKINEKLLHDFLHMFSAGIQFLL